MKQFAQHSLLNLNLNLNLNLGFTSISIPFLILLFVQPILSQSPNDTLAMVGIHPVLAREVLERLELMPFPGKEQPSLADTTKFRATYAFVSEKLLAAEAHRQGIAEDASTRRLRDGLENLLIRDEVYRREVLEHVRVSEAEITFGERSIQTELRVVVFGVHSEADGKSVASLINNRRVPAPLVRDSLTRLCTSIDTLTVNFGSAEVALERAAYGLKLNSASQPVRSRSMGWTVLSLLSHHSNTLAAKLNGPDTRRRVEKLIQTRKENARTEEVYYNLLGDQQARMDSVAFDLLASSISALWNTNPSTYKKSGMFTLPAEALEILEQRLATHLADKCVMLAKEPLTVGEVLEMFRYADFGSRTAAGDTFLVDLNDQIKDIVANELISQRGRAMQVQYSDNVQREMKRWSDTWAAHALLARVTDSIHVSDEDCYAYLLRNKEFFGKRYNVNVREVLSPDAASSAQVLKRYLGGTALNTLAKEKSIRTAWASREGESGLFFVGEHPELGFHALLSDTNSLSGPFTLPEGVSIFRLLQRKSVDAPSVDTLRALMLGRLLQEKQQNTLDKYIASLARDQKVRWWPERIGTLKTTSTQMFTRRHIGFGGTMTAVPLLLQQWTWVNEVRPAIDQLP